MYKLVIYPPTALGAIIAFLVCRAIAYGFGNAQCKHMLLSAVLIICISIPAKAAVGTVMYKTGLHLMPKLNSPAGIWTVELGTRPLGKDTGTCSYSPYNQNDDFDEIQSLFSELWKEYYYCEEIHKEGYATVKQTEDEIKNKLINRMVHTSIHGHVENFKNKSVNFRC